MAGCVPGLHHQLTGLCRECMVVASSKILILIVLSGLYDSMNTLRDGREVAAISFLRPKVKARGIPVRRPLAPRPVLGTCRAIGRVGMHLQR